ncbi:MAG TPA: serine hydrolase domain-containing protein [Puia sp.]|nr:serine hydrolase domain-containing protein [Puia sp.]
MTKKLIVVIACAILGLGSIGQTSLAKFREVNELVVAEFNSGDFKAIYAAAGQTYKDLNSEGELTGTLNYMKNTFGQVKSSQLIEDLGDIKYFKWNCEKGAIRFELWIDGSSIIQYKLNNLVMQPDAITKRPVTDNLLKNGIDSLVNKYAAIYMSDPKAVGLSLGVYYHGRKYIYNYGEMEKGSGRPVTDQTIFTVGSITKTFTGVLLCRAVSEKKASFGDDIRKYLDGNYPNLEYQGHPITLLDLARHTSGVRKFRFNVVPASADNWSPEEWMRYFDTYTWDSLFRDLHALRVDTLPGVQYHYSLIGTTLLNIAIEKIYHGSIDQIVRDYYGHEFHMKDTKLASDAGDIPRYATGYGDKGQLMPRTPEYTPSLSSIHSTTRDMMSYLEANVLETNPVIKLSHKKTWGDMKAFAVGIPWDMETYYGKYEMIWHSGFDYGSISLCAFYPEMKMGMFLWANDDSRQSYLYDMERSIRQSLIFQDSFRKRRALKGGSKLGQ